jgi:hypothetical protein
MPLRRSWKSSSRSPLGSLPSEHGGRDDDKVCAKCGAHYTSLNYHLSNLNDTQFRKHGGTVIDGKRQKPGG